jgi:hypothetical protein
MSAARVAAFAGGALPLFACGEFTPEYLRNDEAVQEGARPLRRSSDIPARGSCPHPCRAACAALPHHGGAAGWRGAAA